MGISTANLYPVVNATAVEKMTTGECPQCVANLVFTAADDTLVLAAMAGVARHRQQVNLLWT